MTEVIAGLGHGPQYPTRISSLGLVRVGLTLEMCPVDCNVELMDICHPHAPMYSNV